jgi:nicotinate-nucleotide adenylyltransferase
VTLKRIGIFGGAFDPPHRGHWALARAAIEGLGLDALHIIPTGQAWHKPRDLTAAVHRLAMCSLNFMGLPGIVIDERELHRTGASYTIDTLLELRSTYGPTELFLCMGLDQALALPTWHRWAEVVSNATICVAVRADSAGISDPLPALESMAPGFRLLPMESLQISATAIRQRVAAGQSVSGLVFDPVARYIDHHSLYQRP